MVYAVILAGGYGERFWPLSRRKRPKQLIPIVGEKSMIETTIDRIRPDFPPEKVWVVTGSDIGEAIRERVSFLPPANILEEPKGNNTCLAIGLAAVELSARDPDATLVVLSADHVISPAETLRRILREGVRLAQSEACLVTIGVTPTRAETAYGYIKQGPNFATTDGIVSYQVEAFREKPDRPKAQDYFFSRRHLWNSGMFVWTADSLLKAIAAHSPGVAEPLAEYRSKIGTESRDQALQDLYEKAECVSIDVGVLERADNVIVIKGDLAWDDVGSWLALGRHEPADSDNNLVRGAGVAVDTFDTTLFNDTDDLVCTFGVSDLVVVRTGRAVLVAHKSRLDEIKQLMEKLKSDDKWQDYL